MLCPLNVCQLCFHKKTFQLCFGIHEFIGFGVFIMFSRIHYVLEYSLYYYAIFGSPAGNHECAGMHNGGNVDRSIGRDLPHSSAWRAGRVHIVSNRNIIMLNIRAA